MKSTKVRPLASAVKEWLGNALFGYMHRTGLVMAAAHVGVAAYTGNKYYVCATLPETYDQAGYESTDLVWTEIGGVSDFPAYGPKRAVGTFIPINGGIEKFVGAPNYGSGNLVAADLPTDAGQVILKAAEASNGVRYAFKVLNVDGEKDYTIGLLAGWELAAAKENTAKTRTGMLEFTKPIVNVAAPA